MDFLYCTSQLSCKYLNEMPVLRIWQDLEICFSPEIGDASVGSLVVTTSKDSSVATPGQFRLLRCFCWDTIAAVRYSSSALTKAAKIPASPLATLACYPTSLRSTVWRLRCILCHYGDSAIQKR